MYFEPDELLSSADFARRTQISEAKAVKIMREQLPYINDDEGNLYLEETEMAYYQMAQSNAPNWIYFVRAHFDYIKIGRSNNVPQRLQAHRGSSPLPLFLMAVAPGAAREERLLHKKFRSEHSHGEWFLLGPRLRKFIEKVQCLFGPTATKGFADLIEEFEAA